MNTTLHPLAEIFRMNTTLFRNCIAGMTDEHARHRIGQRTNNAGFIVLHVVDARFHLARLLGGDIVNPYGDQFESVRALEDIKELPPLTELTEAWDEASVAVMNALQQAEQEGLRKSAPAKLPISDESILGAIAFFAQHESYHLGQLGFLRKELGLGRMKWGEQ
jgi:uncharacterized damage-inducible protein DinB